MVTEEAFNDRRLLDVIALLGSRKESGRLRISDGTIRGAFFFNNGKLVAAHMGPLGGFQAVNLAISVDRPQLSFNHSVQSPSQSNFKLENERMLLKERYGIDTADPLPARKQAVTNSDEVPAMPIATAATPVVEVKKPSSTINPVPSEPDRPLDASSSTLEGIGSDKKRTESTFRFVPRNLFSYASRRQMFTLLAGLMIIATVSTTAGIASFWTKIPEIRQPAEAPRENTRVNLQPAATAASLHSQAEAATPLKAEDTSAPTQVSPRASLPPLPVKSETRSLNQPSETSRIETAVITPAPEIQRAEPLANLTTLTIPVVVEITDGHVTGAFIQRPQSGFRAHEATALRLARQRRFPKGTNGEQTITLLVSQEP
jgi:hypothetical protein